ncbi:MAG: hypothetical protein QE279_10140 [Rhodoferax sp.]|nr:hypothetical protein [Rhodoferax sp.]
MSKFRTKIAHKKGSEIEIFGHTIKMTPDEGQGDPGLCTFEVPDDRDDVFARLVEIPEGFELLDEVGDTNTAKKPLKQESEAPAKTDAPSLIIEGDGGATVDLYKADKATLLAIGKDLGLTIAPATGVEKVRDKVIAAFKDTVKA